MRKATLGVVLALLSPVAHAAANLRRSEGNPFSRTAPNMGPQADCKTVSTTGREFFEVAVSSKQYLDRKLVIFNVLDTYTTNYVEVSSFSSTTNGEGFPVSSDKPLRLEAGFGLRFFIRRPSGQIAVPGTVCGLQIE